MTRLQVKNTGPIEGTFEFEFSGPGAYELRGSQGSGKSTVLSSLDAITGHKVNLTVHDGEREGRVAGFGVVVPVGSRKRRKGELQAETLDAGKYAIGDIIRPDGKTGETRDATRLKALVAVLGIKVTAKDLGADAYDVEPTDDPILLATRIKTTLEKQARQLESEADKLSGQAQAKLDQCDGVDLEAQHDSDELLSAFEGASNTLVQLTSQREAAEKSRESRNKAKAEIEAIDLSGPDAPTLAKLYGEAEILVSTLKEQLADAEREQARLDKAYAERKELERRLASLTEIVEESEPACPSDEAIEQAKARKDAARIAMENGKTVRNAIEAAAIAGQLTANAGELTEKASDLRGAARGVYDTLAKKLKLKTMRVESIGDALRIVVDHPKRGKTLYDQDDGLSGGERVKWCLDEIRHMFPEGKPALLPVEQRCWQDLQPAVRLEFDAYAREHGIYVIGAQVSEGELRIVPISEDNE